MTTVTAETADHVCAIHIELPYGQEGNMQGTTEVIFTAPEGASFSDGAPHVVVGTIPSRRQIADLGPEVAAAIEVLKAAVANWPAEDLAAAAELEDAA